MLFRSGGDNHGPAAAVAAVNDEKHRIGGYTGEPAVCKKQLGDAVKRELLRFITVIIGKLRSQTITSLGQMKPGSPSPK